MTGLSAMQRRYLRRLIPAMAVYVVSLIGAIVLIERELVEGPLVWVLAAIPGLAIVGAFYAIAMLIVEQTDEFLRMLVVRQSLIATGLALSLATVWGFLETFALVPHLPAWWVAIAWFLGFAVGGLVNRLTYGSWGQCL